MLAESDNAIRDVCSEQSLRRLGRVGSGPQPSVRQCQAVQQRRKQDLQGDMSWIQFLTVLISLLIL